MTKLTCRNGHSYDSEYGLPTQCPAPGCDLVAYQQRDEDENDFGSSVATVVAETELLSNIFDAPSGDIGSSDPAPDSWFEGFVGGDSGGGGASSDFS